MTILYVPKNEKDHHSKYGKRRMKQIMVQINKDENEMIVKYNITR